MMILPILGGLLLSAAGEPIPFFGAHALAALCHHFVSRANTLISTLTSTLPRRP